MDESNNILYLHPWGKRVQVSTLTTFTSNAEIKWRCPTCQVENEVTTAATCICCNEKNPNQDVASSTAPNPSSKTWTCSTCNMENELEELTCACLSKKNTDLDNSIFGNVDGSDKNNNNNSFEALALAHKQNKQQSSTEPVPLSLLVSMQSSFSGSASSELPFCQFRDPSKTLPPNAKPQTQPKKKRKLALQSSKSHHRQCTIPCGNSTGDRKRNFNQIAMFDSPILQEQMGPEIKQQIYLPYGKRMVPPSGGATNLYKSTSHASHEYFHLFENMLASEYNIEKDPQFPKFQAISLDNQINELTRFQTLSPEERRIRWQLVYDTLSCLRKYYKECEVYGFGSLITGFKSYQPTLDMEFSVDLGQGICCTSNIMRSISPTLRLGLGPEYKFSNQETRRGSMTAILMHHAPSDLTSELIFHDKLPQHDTSMLIKYYSDLDPTIQSFLAVIRHWAKVHQIMGIEPKQLSEYTIFMLALVYLMDQRELPSVEVLVERNIIQQGTFTNRKQGQHDVSLNKCRRQDVIEMITGFCNKYSNLDFAAVVISPHFGKIIPRKHFRVKNYKKLPKALRDVVLSTKNIWEELSLHSPICVQDPFVLHGSISWDKSKDATEKLTNICTETLNVLSKKHKGRISLLDLFVLHGQTQTAQQHQPGDNENCDLQNSSDNTTVKKDVVDNNMKKPEENNSDDKSTIEKVADDNTTTEITDNSTCIGPKQREPPGLKLPSLQKTRLKFSVDGEFVGLYMKTLQGSQIKEALWATKLEHMLKTKLFTLWREFSTEFLKNIFEDGLKLSVSNDPEVIIVTYPFWKGRAEMIEYGENNPIDIERKQSGVIVNYFEGRTSRNSDESQFSEFNIPLTVNFINGDDHGSIPTVEIVLQNWWNVGLANPNDYMNAVETISRILKRSFSLYQIYRMKCHKMYE